jgi:hypothetical protein
MEANMGPQPSTMKPSSRRAVRARSRIVFFLLRRVLRRLANRAGRPAGQGRRGIAALAAHHS